MSFIKAVTCSVMDGYVFEENQKYYQKCYTNRHFERQLVLEAEKAGMIYGELDEVNAGSGFRLST